MEALDLFPGICKSTQTHHPTLGLKSQLPWAMVPFLVCVLEGGQAEGLGFLARIKNEWQVHSGMLYGSIAGMGL